MVHSIKAGKQIKNREPMAFCAVFKGDYSHISLTEAYIQTVDIFKSAPVTPHLLNDYQAQFELPVELN